MHIESVEIFSDETNRAVMRHPGRKFPGILIEGDSLSALCQQADVACAQIARDSAGFDEANKMRNALWSYLNHYKSTLDEHGIGLPFSS